MGGGKTLASAKSRLAGAPRRASSQTSSDTQSAPPALLFGPIAPCERVVDCVVQISTMSRHTYAFTARPGLPPGAARAVAGGADAAAAAASRRCARQRVLLAVAVPRAGDGRRGALRRRRRRQVLRRRALRRAGGPRALAGARRVLSAGRLRRGVLRGGTAVPSRNGHGPPRRPLRGRVRPHQWQRRPAVAAPPQAAAATAVGASSAAPAATASSGCPATASSAAAVAADGSGASAWAAQAG